MIAQQLVNALTLGSVYALFALGFTLVFGVLEVINLSHGAVFMVGAYVALLLVTKANLGIWVALPLAMLLSGVLGLLIDQVVLKPLRARRAHHLMPMIATIGAATLTTNAVQGIFGAETSRFPFGTIPEESFQVGAILVTELQMAIVIISFLLMVLLVAILQRTRLGKAVRAVAENPQTSYLLGINVEGIFRLVSFTAAALGGGAGVLIGLSFNAIYPFMGQTLLPKGVAVIILGGMGDVRGAMVGGLFLGVAEVMSVAYLSSDYRDAVAFGLLFLILLVRPSGLFGRVVERKA
ncbi:MAG: branched-chain amino acid ABC transporter permease [Deltaproteobacteria bacterium]|nr:branched-chain amino acid ABC transporter permease [Deltaproteobacteria bacterium]